MLEQIISDAVALLGIDTREASNQVLPAKGLPVWPSLLGTTPHVSWPFETAG